MAIYRGLWSSDFQADFHAIHECMFGLSFLTILNIYKDYFKGCKRLHKLHKSEAKSCSCKLWPETEFALVHRSCEEVAVFVHRRVLWPSIFSIFIMWWTGEFCSQQPSLVGDQSHVLGFVQLVSYVLGAVHWKGEIVTIEQVQVGIGVRVQL